MNVKEIIEKYCKENGFDGLCNAEIECGCSISDFFPCIGDCADCEPAYLQICNDQEQAKHALDEDCNSDCDGQCFRRIR